MGINALEVSENIKKTYINYLTTTFEFENEDLMDQFKAKLKEENFIVKGPILDITPTFDKGKSINELIEEGVLSQEFIKADFHLNRKLYKHQEKAIRKIKNGRNIIVSTGTGSGKTESFLLPILNHLFEEKEKGTLNPGVRALILYPMNALASDQLKRLRGLLKKYPEITFGSYTGEVKEKYTEALDDYKNIHGFEPLKNELISREQIKKEPPNILITNYSMLEYLLLRPEDNTLFSGEYGKCWKYLVIDEAHMYSGAKGIEIAMLLRRLQVEIDKLGKGMQFILTSASLGSGKEDYPKIAEFGSKLCSSSFEVEDIIEAERIETIHDEYLKYPVEIYEEIWKLIKNENLNLKNLEELFLKYNIYHKYAYKDEKEFLFEVFSRDERIYKIKNILKNNYYPLKVAVKKVDESLKIETLIAIIEIANKAVKDDEVLIPGRYHMFARALEGAYLTLKPALKLHLTPQISYNYNNKKYQSFEIGVCQNCKKVYIIGKQVEDGEYEKITIVKNYLEDLGKVNYYLLESLEDTENFEDADESIDIGEKLELEKYQLCACCGRIHIANGKEFCDCGKENYVTVTKVSTKTQDGKLHKCISCGKFSPINSIVRKVVAGTEASTSVLLDNLYKNIIDNKDSEETKKIIELKENDDDFFDIDFEETDESTDKSPEEENCNIIKSNKQILAFSDSRQNAAYFATYFDSTYDKLLRRQLLVSILKNERNEIEKYTAKDLINALSLSFRKYYDRKEFTEKDIEKEAKKTVLYEFMGIDGKNGLEDIGILTFKNVLKPKNNFLKNYGLTLEDIPILIDILLYGVRKVGAVISNGISDAEWEEYFQNVSRHTSFSCEESSEKHSSLKRWIAIKKNQRKEYLEKLGVDPLHIDKILKGIFSSLIKANVLVEEKDSLGFSGYKINPDKFTLVSVFSSSHKYYRCKKCKKITPFNIKNKCHVYRCDGELEEISIKDLMKDNHYWKNYMNPYVQTIKVAEHTAQLEKDEAKKKQEDFIKGKINILSCSTTFEVGVDVGELETVFMRNMPPSPANYVQRAGRAGRRLDSTAFALTYGSLKSHDFINFKNPERMISGKIAPPIFNVENYKIVKRHIYATALSQFWKDNKEFYGKEFIKFLNGGKGIEKFKEYLNNNNNVLFDKITKIVPKNMEELLGLKEWKWVEELVNSKEDGRLDLVAKEFLNDIQQYREIYENLIKNRQTKYIDYINKNLRLMENRKLIEVLSRGNIIPKYGFPVDTVKLSVRDKEVDLNRDLQQALLDYVPDSEIIANGKIYKSRYVKYMPNKALDRYEYRICKNCNQITRVKKFVNEDLEYCGNCGEELKKYWEYSSEYRIPVFGFVAEDDSKKAGIKKPERTARIEKFYVGNSNKIETEVKKLNIKNVNFELRFSKSDKMAIIGMGKGFGFLICPTCGYGEVITDLNSIEKKRVKPHKTSAGKECKTYLERTDLGYEFETDVVLIHTMALDRIPKEDESSVLYSFLEGMSRALSIERNDIDGCFYGISDKRYLVIYDKVPGGAGHSKRLLNPEELEKTLEKAYSIVKNCNCGEETACYSCIRNYNNQWYHEELSRKKAIKFYETIFA